MNTYFSRLKRLTLTGVCLILGTTCSYAEENSTDTAAILGQAKQVWKRGDGKKAISLLRQVIKLQPNNVDAHATLGWVLFTTGKQQEAIKEEQKAIAINPKNWDAHHTLAGMYVETHQYARAANEFRICKKIDPQKGCNCGGMKALMYLYPEGSSSNQTPKQPLQAK
jgi:Tfp pilus assembly protein PilF